VRAGAGADLASLADCAQVTSSYVFASLLPLAQHRIIQACTYLAPHAQHSSRPNMMHGGWSTVDILCTSSTFRHSTITLWGACHKVHNIHACAQLALLPELTCLGCPFYAECRL
jgi:hypothetical protein